MNKNFFSARNVSFLAILLTLVIVLQAALGTVQIGAVQLNFSLIPIVLGALLYGPIVGGVLGFASGVVVLIQVIMGLSPFYIIIWTESPVVTTMICLFKTTVAGLVAGVLYKVIKKKNAHVATFVAAGTVPIINTALFIIGCLFMNNTISAFKDSLLGVMPEVGGMNAFIFILVVLVTFNFFIEFAINLIVAPSLYRVVKIIDKQFGATTDDVQSEEESDDVGDTFDTKEE
jgi:uncharacterized membrane protein